MRNMIQWSSDVGVLVKRQDGSSTVKYCVPCEKTVPEPELLPHLQGKDHCNNLHWYIMQHPSPSQLLLSALPAVVQAAKRNNEVELVEKSSFSYKCRLCDKKAPFTGLKTLELHLDGREHRKAALSLSSPPSQHPPRQPQLTPPLQPQLTPPPQPQLTPPLQSQLTPPPQPHPTPYRNNVGASALQPNGSLPDVDRALATGVLVRTGATAYKCVVCNREATGPKSMQQHLSSDKHKNKAVSHPDFSFTVSGGDARTPSRVADSLRVGQGREDQVDASWRLPWTVVSSRSYQQPSENVYRNLSVPRGLVLIFNYYHIGSRNERLGAPRDSFNIKTLFTSMGYHVYLYEDFTKAETKEILQKNIDSPFLHQYDSLIVFVLSHGKDDKYFITRDDDCMTLDEVRYSFTDTSCPALKDKPKLFFINFCRGSRQEPQIQYDSLSLQHAAPKDMVTMYACISGYQAPRDPQNGTLFVQVWCAVLAAHAHHKELQDLHKQVCDLVVDRGGATPEMQNYYFKKFYFNPVKL